MQIYIANGRVSLIKTPEVIKSKNGTSKFQFDFVTDSTYKDSEGNTLSTFFHVISYGKQAELLANVLAVGSPILIRGQVIDRPYKNEKNERRTYRFILPDKQDGITFLEGKEAGLLRKKMKRTDMVDIQDSNETSDQSFEEEYGNSFPEDDDYPF